MTGGEARVAEAEEAARAERAGSSGRTARVLDTMIGGYQALRWGRPSPCRFLPSCSDYAREAVATHGPARGSRLALRRLGRCRPGGGHGWDPVPEAGSAMSGPPGPGDGDPRSRTAG